jgi:hypothetical protein
VSGFQFKGPRALGQADRSGAPIPESKPDTILLYEVYADAAAFGIHSNGTSLAQARKEAGSIIVSMTGMPCSDMSAQVDGKEEDSVYAV